MIFVGLLIMAVVIFVVYLNKEARADNAARDAAELALITDTANDVTYVPKTNVKPTVRRLGKKGPETALELLAKLKKRPSKKPAKRKTKKIKKG